ncbi:sugar ABC transporter ATP-binding protein [Aeromicrobium sp. A1-2]|uniref:sugar ABC transporter ATP-binding protein n=1 Tax=Aeromicrobium sp. A1-2 TaxID=2107713 RepID=UPI000E47AB08|nr:sugar ABC transporter ATP-binding protein [Aeromicrobium sp. A1-2]AXT84259.1 sugar ABC transporter ATP-binding protein [Aeromicrobium sp. A1-2]
MSPAPSNPSTNLIQVTGLAKSYGAVKALKSADFNLAHGEVMALVGENGAGKSTFVKIMCGFVRRDTGSIEIEGVPVSLGSARNAERAGVAVVQQELSVVGSLSVAENVFLGRPGSSKVFTSRRLAEMAAPYLEMVGLGHVNPHAPASSIPVAERQLVEIARVVSGDAKVIMLDEPTASLSDADIARVKVAVRRLRSEGRSVVYITHRLDEVFDLADRVTVIRDGRSLPAINVADTNPDALIESMLGRELSRMFPDRATQVGDVVLQADDLVTDGVTAPVALKLRRGEIHGMAGQLGSGASEILKALSGTQAMTRGTIHIGGRAVRTRSPREALRAGIAYCSADRKHDGFFAGQPISKNFTAPGLAAVSPGGIIRGGAERQMAQHLAGLVNFNPARLKHRIETLSGGNQQKVVLGKWLGAEPDVLLIEEPTRGVDVGARAEIYRHLRHLTEQGLSIIVVSSDIYEVHGFCDTVSTWYRGRQIDSYDGDSVTYEQLIIDITNPKGAAA